MKLRWMVISPHQTPLSGHLCPTRLHQMVIWSHQAPSDGHSVPPGSMRWSFGPTRLHPMVIWPHQAPLDGHLVPPGSLIWSLVVLGSLRWPGVASVQLYPREGHFPSSLTPHLLSQAREELRPVKEDFEAKNKQLLEEMPKFYSSRIDYFKPSFESLVRAQVRCCPLSGRCPFGGILTSGSHLGGNCSSS